MLLLMLVASVSVVQLMCVFYEEISLCVRKCVVAELLPYQKCPLP
jgi:hypothetical protein